MRYVIVFLCWSTVGSLRGTLLLSQETRPAARQAALDSPAETAPSDTNGDVEYRSPTSVAYSPDGRLIATGDKTSQSLVLIDTKNRKVVREIALGGRPHGLVWAPDGRTVCVAVSQTGRVLACDVSGEIRQRIAVGPRPEAVAIVARSRTLLVTDSAEHNVRAVDLLTGRERSRVAVSRQPEAIAVTPDERLAVVANRLPADDATDARAAAVVSLVGLDPLRSVATVRLPPGSTNAADVTVHPDGRWAFVTHNVGRTALPTTQIEYGWINANAVTVIDLRQLRRHATILLDNVERGAANPWGIRVAPDGKALWVALSGVHELAEIDLPALHVGFKRLSANWTLGGDMKIDPDEAQLDTYVAGQADDAAGDPRSVEVMATAKPVAYGMGLFIPDVQRRVKLPGHGARAIDISNDGSVAVGLYFTGEVVLLNDQNLASVPIAQQPKENLARRGERIFHDAEACYQNWLSCATCHPDGRTDGLNWDLLNDGGFNAKNTKSLVWADRTPPMMARGVRPDMRAAVAAGFRHILFSKDEAERVDAVAVYLRQLEPQSGPEEDVDADRGRRLFFDSRVGCAACHPPPLFTDLKKHDVGTGVEFEHDVEFDTPTLRELWRTGPYLHHGKARTFRDVLTTFNLQDRHGRTAHLSRDEIEALVDFLQSL